MKLTGQQRIAAPRQRVWEALNDPEILKRAIPGCQSLEKDGDKFRASVALKIGPMDARFAGAVTLTDLDPPNAYTIIGQGQGGAAGFAKGSVRVSLADDGAATLLSYDTDAQVGGRLAQLGGPIIEATAKQLTGQFFARFSDILAPQTTKPSPASRAPAAHTAQERMLAVPWVLSLVVALLAGLILGGAHNLAGGDWTGFAIGLIVILGAAVGFEFGRRAASPVVLLDATLARKLSEAEHKR